MNTAPNNTTNTRSTQPMRRQPGSAPQHGPRLSRFCFTLNNWDEAEYVKIINQPSVSWMIVAKEHLSEGTPHLQGAVCLNKQVAWSTIKHTDRGLGRAHIEPMNGEPADSLVYCSKEDPSPFIKGTMPNPGKRTDLIQVYDAIKSDMTLLKLIESFPATYIRYNKGITQLRHVMARKQTKPPIVYWIYGTTGTGKSRLAHEIARIYNEPIWTSNPPDLKWFDHYDQHNFALFDDFRPKHCAFDFLLRLCDRYPLSVPCKGGFTQWSPRVLFITTPHSVEDTFATRNEYKPEDITQLRRRLSGVFKLESATDDTGRSRGTIPNLIGFNTYESILPALLSRLEKKYPIPITIREDIVMGTSEEAISTLEFSQ